MDRNVCVSLVILAFVLTAGPDTEARAVYNVGQAVMPTPSSSSMTLEDGVAPELGAVTAVDMDVHSRVFVGVNGIGLDPERPVCPKSPCAAPGQPYTPGCKAIYHCRH
ncbi:hypothetical protein ZWY2020_026677 [Hordeum vulgare]|nr:hypothetical protein ZWY2020_026677 [Hordeum vulgare]